LNPVQAKPKTITFVAFLLSMQRQGEKNEGWLAQSQDNLSEWSYMSICGLSIQLANTMKIQLSILV